MKWYTLFAILSIIAQSPLHTQESQNNSYIPETALPNFLNIGNENVEAYTNVMVEVLIKEKMANNLYSSNSIFQKKVLRDNNILMIQVKKEIHSTESSHILCTIDIKWKQSPFNQLNQNSNVTLPEFSTNN